MFGRLLLLVGSVLFSLLLLEAGLRLARGPEWLVKAPNLVLEGRTLTRLGGEGRAVHDDRLGFVPKPGFTSRDVNYDELGFRRTPSSSRDLAEPPILVVGDSFAHGDEVADGEAWPALLQPLVQRRVVNAAMSGYGIDQMVLRAEDAVPNVTPAAIVLSFITDDSRRMEMKRVWGMEKPWFTVENGALVEHNVPVPPSPAPVDTLDFWQRTFGWSLLIETVMKRLGRWYDWVIDYARVLPEHEGEALACPVFRRLAGLGLPTLVVAEYDPFVWRDPQWGPEARLISGKVLACASAAGLATLDLYDTIDGGVKQQSLEAMFGVAHLTPAGTTLAARKIAEALEKDHIPPR
ncbi:MAG: SGNH/GDSL hydrolase family protein [Alphaproteobacteria bacterium]|nr:SGNH/GDSL hydrolase family protein [Alphaproteobacteria bacterium]